MRLMPLVGGLAEFCSYEVAQLANPLKDRPVNTAVLVCILTGAVSILFGRFVPLASGPTASVSKRPEVPLAEQFELSSSRPSSPSPEYGSSRSNSFLHSRFLWTVVLVLVICGARVELFRRITFQNECAPHGYAVRSPLRLIAA